MLILGFHSNPYTYYFRIKLMQSHTEW